MSSLKKALQPSVTDVVLTFDVPDGVVVQQSPSKIPPVFNGERLVMYGVLKSKTKSAISGQCMATLNGKLLGGAVRHTVEFTAGNRREVVPGSFPVSVIHHLAAKRLIKDWESGEGIKDLSDEDKKKSIINLSVDSNVTSTHTAYVAVDEVHGKSIEGAMKMWDLTATEGRIFRRRSRRCLDIFPSAPVPRSQGFQVQEFQQIRGPLGGGIHGSGGGVHENGAFGSAIAASDALGSGFLGSDIVVTRTFKLNHQSYEYSAMGSCRMVNTQQKRSAKPSRAAKCFAGLERTVNLPESSQTSFLSPLSQLIALQTAEGFWQLDKQLADIVGQPVEKLVKKCPATGMESVWATLLALTLLKERFSSQEEEWELVAIKAKTWLQNQTIPGPHSLDSLSQAAKECLA